MLKIFVIILTYNSEKIIRELLDSLKPLKSAFSILVVDNKSKDKTVSIIKKNKFVKLIANKKNLGFGAGSNIGIKYALSKGADVVFLLNPDTVLKSNFLENFNASTVSLLKDENIGIIGAKIYDVNGKIWSVGGEIEKNRYSGHLIGYEKEDVGQYNNIKEIDYIPGTAMFVKKEVFEKVGFFKEDYFLYYEDVDFCLRIKKAGFELAIDSNIEVIHKASSSVGLNSKIMQYYMARNHLIFVERFAPMRVKLREIVRLPKTLYEARDKESELFGIRDYFLRRFFKNDNWR